MNGEIGKWSFIIGLIIAVIASLIDIPYVGYILAVLGLIVGFLNVTGKESVPFLVAAIALMMTAASLQVLGAVLTKVFENVAVFVAPGALVVAIKAVYGLASSK